MANKKLFAGITAAVAVLGVLAATGISNSDLIFTKAADAEYTLTVTASDIKGLDSVPYVTTTLGNQVKVGGSELTIDTTINMVGGSLYVVDPLNGIKSLTVDVAEESTLPTLQYGWTSGEYAAETITLEDDVAADLTALTPNYFKLEGTANIVSIDVTYSCTPGTKPVSINDVYVNVGIWWTGNAWYTIHAWDSDGNYFDAVPTQYLGNKLYKFELPTNMTNFDLLRKDPANLKVGYDKVWNKFENFSIKDDMLITVTDWNKKPTPTTFTSASKITYNIAGSMNGWNGSAHPLTDNGDGTFTYYGLEVAANAELKIQENAAWDQCYGLNGGTDGGTGNIKIAKAGKYNITLSWTKENCIPQVTIVAA